MASEGGRIKTVKFWALKIFFIALFLAGAISLLTEYLTKNISIFFALVVLIVIVLIGVAFDIIGIAFATCDKKPFVAMASKKIKKAREALMLLKNAPAVTSFCNDVIGDICGIISGATGAAIAIKIIAENPSFSQIAVGIIFSSAIAALTIALKAMGKKLAIRKNKEIVGAISAFLSVFAREKKG